MKLPRSLILAAALIAAAPAFLRAQDGKVNFDLQEVSFAYADDQAKAVSLVGDFNCWNEYVHDMQKGPDGIWKKTLRLRKGRVYEYAFSVDGRWVADAKNPIHSAQGNLSLLFLPGGDPEVGLAGGDMRPEVAVTLTYKKVQEQLDAIIRELAALRATGSAQAGEIAKRDAELELLRNQVATLRIEKSALAHDLDDLRKQHEQLIAKYEAGQGDPTAAARSAQLEARVKELTRLLGEAQSTLNKMTQDKLSNEGLASQTLKDYAELKKQFQELDAKYQEAGRDLAEKTRLLDANALPVAPAPAPVAPPPEPRTAPHRVVGEIQVVSPDTNILIITAGSREGLREGDTLIVLRNNQSMGRIIVEGVHDGYSSAHTPDDVDWHTLQPGDKIAIEEP